VHVASPTIKLSCMDIGRLQLLRELRDRGSITAVAAATRRTPSAVSQQLKVLEREAGVPLTEPSGRGLALTSAGRTLARTADELATAIERAEAEWNEFRAHPLGTVTMRIFPSGGQMLLPGLLTAVAATPGLELEVDDLDFNDDDVSDQTADADVIVVDSPGIEPAWAQRGLAVAPLLREPLDVALPEGHPLGRKSALAPEDVVDETWIGVPHAQPFDRILRDIEVLTGTAVHRAQRISDNGIVEALVAAGHGLAILPRFTTRQRENGLITRPLLGVRASRLISALMRPDRAQRPSVRAVVAALRSEGERFAQRHSV
jgi:DNA-binding transcriptional LysR family regulator